MAEQRKPASSPARSPVALAPTAEAPKESSVVRLLIAPLTFVSFLLSLALVSERNLALRHSSHDTYPNTTWGHMRAILHAVVFKKVDASPYSYVKSPNPTSSSLNVDSPGESNGGKAREKEPWHWHTKQRHMMKAEMDDAFRVRKWVVLGLGALLLLATGGVMWSAWCVLGILMRGGAMGKEL